MTEFLGIKPVKMSLTDYFAPEWGKKFVRYRACSFIQEIVCIEAQRQHIMVYQRLDEKVMLCRTYEFGESVALVSLGVNIPLATLYRHVQFPQEGEGLL